jgi:hypothetical protein
MTDGSNVDRILAKIDGVLAKYITVWVWSVLVGINTSLTFSFVGYSLRSRGPTVLVVLGPVYVAGMLATMFAWWFVVSYLRFFIVPNFFWTSSGDLERDRRAWGTIRLIGLSLLVAIGLRLVLTILDFLLSSTPLGGY